MSDNVVDLSGEDRLLLLLPVVLGDRDDDDMDVVADVSELSISSSPSSSY